MEKKPCVKLFCVAAWNVLWAVLIGGVATAAIFMFASAGWVRWALFLPIVLWVGGCIKVAIRDVLWFLKRESARKSTDPSDTRT